MISFASGLARTELRILISSSLMRRLRSSIPSNTQRRPADAPRGHPPVVEGGPKFIDAVQSLRHHYAKLGEMAAHGVGELCALAHQQVAHGMRRERRLLLDGLDWDEAHVGPTHQASQIASASAASCLLRLT